MAVDRQITTARDLYEWASTPGNLPNINVAFSPQENYNAAKTELETRFKNAIKIPGIQKIHCAIPHPNTITVKKYSNSDKSIFYEMVKCKNG